MLESTEYAVIKLLSFVKSFYNVPRFGHSKDISYFFSDTSTLRNDYNIGLLLVFMILMSIAALWLITLVILRLLGKKAGCASGSAATIPAESMIPKGGYSVNTDDTGEFIVMQADQNRVNHTRIAYFISGICTLGGCGVLGYGIYLLMRSLTSFHDSVEDGLNHVSTANIDQFMKTAETFLSSRDDLVAQLSGFCSDAAVEINGVNPAAASSAFLTSLSTVDNISSSSAWSALQTDLSDVEIQLERMVSFLGMVDGPVTLWFLLAICITGAIAVFSTTLLGYAWKAGKEGYQFVGDDQSTCSSNFLNYFTTPMFGILLAVMWFGVSTIFTAQTANADFCYGEILTGETVLNMLVERGFAKTTDAYMMVDEFLHGCESTTTTPTAIINDFFATLDDVDIAAVDFQDLTPNGDKTQLQAVCGVDETNNLLTYSDDTITNLETFKTELDLLYSSVSCETMAPIMQQAVYENSCNDMSKGLLWSFIAGLCVAAFGTIMLSLRSATLRPQIFIVAGNPELGLQVDDNSSFG